VLRTLRFPNIRLRMSRGLPDLTCAFVVFKAAPGLLPEASMAACQLAPIEVYCPLGGAFLLRANPGTPTATERAAPAGGLRDNSRFAGRLGTSPGEGGRHADLSRGRRRGRLAHRCPARWATDQPRPERRGSGHRRHEAQAERASRTDRPAGLR